jgi:integrative and conjugative element protein (TIGR02256 family)
MEPEGPAIVLTAAVIETMLKHRQLRPNDNEAGGQLFARFEGKDTILVEATEPKGSDKRKRYWFEPNKWLQRQEIKVKHKCGEHFVGDWHTHPQPIPSPSSDDLHSIAECFRESRHELKAFLMVIVGITEPPGGILVCLVDKRGVKPLKYCP